MLNSRYTPFVWVWGGLSYSHEKDVENFVHPAVKYIRHALYVDDMARLEATIRRLERENNDLRVRYVESKTAR